MDELNRPHANMYSRPTLKSNDNNTLDTGTYLDVRPHLFLTWV